MSERMVEPGLFAEQTIWGKLKGCERWAIWRSRGRVPWQKEKTSQRSKARESLECSRRLGSLEWSEWTADEVSEEQSEARHARRRSIGGGIFFFQEALGRSWGREWHLHFWELTLLQCGEDFWKAWETRRSAGTLEKSKQKVKMLVAVEVEGSYQSQMCFEGKAKRTCRWMERVVVRERKQSEWHLGS